ncbi:podocan [Xylocopa sonorina]|uniref:podocan n=1 Tax=Xylocopa sonorina TaxID=1818115 RepID=UPI00403ABAF8
MKLSVALGIILSLFPFAFKNAVSSEHEMVADAPDICHNETLVLRYFNELQIKRNSIISPRIRCISVKIDRLTIDDGAFDMVPNLQYLDLWGNHISPENLFSFGSLPSVKMLNLGYQDKYNSWNKKLTIIYEYPELRYLDLSGIGINEIRSALRNPFPKLTHLDLSKNGIGVMHIDFLPNTLTHIDISDNRNAKLSLNDASNLLSLTVNNIEDIRTEKRFNGFPSLNLTRLTNLSLVNNKIYTIDDRAFKNMSSLRYLNLSHNSLEMIPTSIKYLNLTVLSLACNSITHLTSDSFSNLVYLRELSFSVNMIKEVHVNTFQDLSLLETLYLDDNRLTNLPAGWCNSMTKLRHLDLSGNKFVTLESVIYSSQLPIEELYFERNSLAYFNADTLRIIPENMTVYLNVNLESKAKQCEPQKKTTVDRYNYDSAQLSSSYRKSETSIWKQWTPNVDQCTDDEVINVSNLGLQEIPRGIVNSKYIKSIVMDNNKIRMINSDEFDGAPNLECLSISNNSISLEGLKLRHAAMKTIILDHQSLSEFEMTNVIRNNFLPQTELEAQFPNVKVLSWRGISYNFLSEFIAAFPNVTTINLADSDLKYMDNSISMYAPNLKSIHLERNSIRQINLEQFGGIRELYLDENPIESFDAFGPQDLTILSLSGCFKDPPGFYVRLRTLQSLDLSNNQFSQILDNMFADVPNLMDLNLSHNRLVEFPDLSGLMSLRKLSLSYNRITRITDISVSSSLETLNLRGNSIENIDKLSFSKLISLEELDLSENKLSSLPQDWSIRMISLWSLNLSSNKFTGIENMKVVKSTNLQHLYVKNNVFPMISSNSLQYHVPQRCTVYV